MSEGLQVFVEAVVWFCWGQRWVSSQALGVCVCVACMAALPVMELLSSLAMVGAEQTDTFALAGAHNAWCLHWLRWVGSPQWW